MDKKFKVGQKIRFTKDCSGFIDIAGLSGKITEIDDLGMYITIKHPTRFKTFEKHWINYKGVKVKGYSFLEDVFDSIEATKKPFWRFWR